MGSIASLLFPSAVWITLCCVAYWAYCTARLVKSAVTGRPIRRAAPILPPGWRTPVRVAGTVVSVVTIGLFVLLLVALSQMSF